MKRNLIPVLLITLFCASLWSEEKEAAPKSEVKKVEAKVEKDWLEFYFGNPTPGEFIPKMKEWAEEGTLRDFEVQPVMIAFTSQLMRQNREQIQDWWLALKDLDGKDRIVFNTALMFARVNEADAIIKDILGDKYREYERPPKILEIPLDKLSAVNMLWGFYYATGSEAAIRRIVSCFRFEEAPEKPEGVDVPKGYKPYYLELPKMAYISLVSNMERHPDLVAICEKMHAEDESLHKTEKTNLYDLLSEIKPKKYPPKAPHPEPEPNPKSEEK